MRKHVLFSKSVSEMLETGMKEVSKNGWGFPCTMKRAPHTPADRCTEGGNRKCLNKCYLVKLMFRESYIVGGCRTITHMLLLLFVPTACVSSFLKITAIRSLTVPLMRFPTVRAGGWAVSGGWRWRCCRTCSLSLAPPQVSLDCPTVPCLALALSCPWPWGGRRTLDAVPTSCEASASSTQCLHLIGWQQT